MKKQTATQWLYDKLPPKVSMVFLDDFLDAEDMEREQMKDLLVWIGKYAKEHSDLNDKSIDEIVELYWKETYSHK